MEAKKNLSKSHSQADETTQSGSSTVRKGEEKILASALIPSAPATLGHTASDEESNATALSLSHPKQVSATTRSSEQVNQHIPGIRNISTEMQKDYERALLASIVSASRQPIQSKTREANRTAPGVPDGKTLPRSTSSSASASSLLNSKEKSSKSESEFRHLKHAGANLVPSKVYAPFDLGMFQDSKSEKTTTTAPPPRPTMPPAPPASKAVGGWNPTLPSVLPTQTFRIYRPPENNATGRALNLYLVTVFSDLVD